MGGWVGEVVAFCVIDFEVVRGVRDEVVDRYRAEAGGVYQG